MTVFTIILNYKTYTVLTFAHAPTMTKMAESNPKKSKLPLYITVGIVVAGILLYFLVPEAQAFFEEAWSVLSSGDEARIEAWVSDFGWTGPLVLILAMVLQMFLIVVPSVALMVVGILAYGPIWGSVIIMGSVFAASSVGYALGSYFGGMIVKKLIGEKTKDKISDFIEEHGFWAIFITRLNPFLSNDAISFVAGMLHMGYWKFIGATLAGIAPLTIFIAILGESNDLLKKGLLWGSGVSLIIFVAYVIWKKKRKTESHD